MTDQSLMLGKTPQEMRLRDRLILFGLQEGHSDVSSLTAFYNSNRPRWVRRYEGIQTMTTLRTWLAKAGLVEQIPGERYCYRITELGIAWCQIWRSQPPIPIPRYYT